nr:hypothetical protein [Tanacetum cinerariifolium]
MAITLLKIHRYKTNGDALRKFILEGPYTPSTIIILVVHAKENSPIVPERTTKVNEICAERIAKNANPLALVAAAQQYPDPYYQASKSHKPYAPASKQASSTRSNASTKFKSKEIAKPITPPSELPFEEDSDPEQAHRDKDMQKNLALIAKYFKKIYKPINNNNLRTSSNSKNKNIDTTLRYKNDNQTGQFGNQRIVNVDGARETIGSRVVQQNGIHCFNYKEFGHFAKECRKPKRVKDSTYHKEKMLLCKQAEKDVQLQAEQSNWLADTDEEIDEQELEAHYSYMAKIQEHSGQPESISNTCVVERLIVMSFLIHKICDSDGGVIGLAISLPLNLVDTLDLVEDACFDAGAYGDLFSIVSTVVRSGTTGEFSFACTTRIMIVEGVVYQRVKQGLIGSIDPLICRYTAFCSPLTNTFTAAIAFLHNNGQTLEALN